MVCGYIAFCKKCGPCICFLCSQTCINDFQTWKLPYINFKKWSTHINLDRFLDQTVLSSFTVYFFNFDLGFVPNLCVQTLAVVQHLICLCFRFSNKLAFQIVHRSLSAHPTGAIPFVCKHTSQIPKKVFKNANSKIPNNRIENKQNSQNPKTKNPE